MSYIYLQEQGAECSAECFSDIPVCVLSKLSLTAEKSFCSDKETECCHNSQSGTMCELLTEHRGEEKLTLYAGASPAKTYLARGKARELTEQEAGYGANLPASFARYDQSTRSWKTAQCSLIEGLDEFSGTWPKSGMMRSGQCWELMMSARPTSESACGFWRTPDTSAGGTVSRELLEQMAQGNFKRKSGAIMQLRLQDQVREPRLFPTPNCSGLDGGSNSRRANKRRGIHQMFYSTPTCRTSKRSTKFQCSNPNMGEVEEAELRKMGYDAPASPSGGELTPQTKTARLNPAWVEWLMGWPIGWTDLKPLATDKFRLWRQLHLEF